jgi:hypothetical protein
VNFFVQRVKLPEVELPTHHIPNMFIPIPNPATRMRFGSFDIDFKVDEEMLNYLTLYHWLRDIGSPMDFVEYNRIYPGSIIQDTGIHSEIELTILTGLANPNFSVVYHSAFPTSLSAMQFQSTEDDVNYVTCTAGFAYLGFDITKVV